MVAQSTVQLILMRHGESSWNGLNRFTGWVDVPLSQKGIDEAFEAGKQLASMKIDRIYTSTLMRAQMTALLAMTHHSSGKVPVIVHEEGRLAAWGQIHSEEAKQQTIPLFCAWQLNERMYGDLQGLNKAATMEKYGKEQVQLWRRSYDIPPPNGESLEMTAARALPYFHSVIVPQLEQGLHLLICAHGNSLRAIIMELDQLSAEQVVRLELPTGAPLIYTYHGGSWEKR